MINRRAAIALGVFGGAYWLSRNAALWDRFGPLPEFTTQRMPDGFRKMAMPSDGVSGGLTDPFAGITVPGTETPAPDFALTSENMDAVLFDTPPAEGVVRMSYSTDYNCPYCRVLGKDLAALATPGTPVSWREMPMLGAGSTLGARAAIAARQQDAYLPFHTRLNTGIVRIDPDYIRSISDDLSLDFNRLERDMASATTDLKLAQSRAVRDRFGVIGTPFLIIESIAINGRISAPMLERLIALERST